MFAGEAYGNQLRELVTNKPTKTIFYPKKIKKYYKIYQLTK
jgi:hypothetical protein